LVIETPPPEISRVPTGMVTLRDAAPLAALRTLAGAIAGAAALVR